MRKLILMSSVTLLALSTLALAQTNTGGSSVPSISYIVSHTKPQFLAGAIAAAIEANPALANQAVAYAKIAPRDVKAAIGFALEAAEVNFSTLHPGVSNPVDQAMAQADPQTVAAYNQAAGQGGTSVLASSGGGNASPYVVPATSGGFSSGGGSVSPN